MDLDLQATDSELKAKFRSLITLKDVADLLEVERSVLIFHLYRQDADDAYAKFRLRKRPGGFREICVPISPLKILQRKLNYVFHLVYPMRDCVHGFVKERSIVTNATPHLRKEYVLNVDIKDFFPSINFGRVRGMLMAKPYGLFHESATVLAQLCCYDNYIPQGAPTSPIVSNMVCGKLDTDLQRLAQRSRCMYTRYADDITFSTTRTPFPIELGTESATKFRLGEALVNSVEGNDFRINQEKVRLQSKHKRQEVTGLLVNTKINVHRSYVRQLRAMLHSWDKFGYEDAEKEYWLKYCKKQRHPNKPPPLFRNVVEGKLNFLKMVVGEDSPVYRKLAYRFSRLVHKPFPKFYTYAKNAVNENVWVVECTDLCVQGTAFMLYSVGFVTCAHLIGDNVELFRYDDHETKFPATVRKIDSDIDLAILKIEDDKSPGLSIGKDSNLPSIGTQVKIAGFPSYQFGDLCTINEAKVSSVRRKPFGLRILLDSGIYGGMSGGPVLSEDNEITGVAVTGADRPTEDPDTENFGVVPISELVPWFRSID